MSLVRINYDPATTALAGATVNKMVVPIRPDPNNPEFFFVRLTAKGNQALFELCHTYDQKTVWQFPSYEFSVRRDSLTVNQVSFPLILFSDILIF